MKKISHLVFWRKKFFEIRPVFQNQEKMSFAYFSLPPQKIESVASNKYTLGSLNHLLLTTTFFNCFERRK